MNTLGFMLQAEHSSAPAVPQVNPLELKESLEKSELIPLSFLRSNATDIAKWPQFPQIITREHVTLCRVMCPSGAVPHPLLIFSSSCRFYFSTDIVYFYLNHRAPDYCFKLMACRLPFSALDSPGKLTSILSASGLGHRPTSTLLLLTSPLLTMQFNVVSSEVVFSLTSPYPSHISPVASYFFPSTYHNM